MTRKETIEKLDELIAYLNVCRGFDINLYEIEREVHSTLKGLPISASTRSAIVNVRASVELPREILMCSGFETMNAERNKKTVVALIDILNREKDAQNQAMQDEAQKENLAQQKRSNKIQIWTLAFSIIAALAALYPIIESLIKKIFN